MTREDMKLRFDAINSKLITAMGMENKVVIKTLEDVEAILNVPENCLHLFNEKYFEWYNARVDEMIANRAEKESDE